MVFPMIVMIGWRGEPGAEDEPQHLKQGAKMESILAACEIPYYILDPNEQNIPRFISKLINHAKTSNCPVAILVRQNTFSPYESRAKAPEISMISREDAIEEVLNFSDEKIYLSHNRYAFKGII